MSSSISSQATSACNMPPSTHTAYTSARRRRPSACKGVGGNAPARARFWIWSKSCMAASCTITQPWLRNHHAAGLWKLQPIATGQQGLGYPFGLERRHAPIGPWIGTSFQHAIGVPYQASRMAEDFVEVAQHLHIVPALA